MAALLLPRNDNKEFFFEIGPDDGFLHAELYFVNGRLAGIRLAPYPKTLQRSGLSDGSRLAVVKAVAEKLKKAAQNSQEKIVYNYPSCDAAEVMTPDDITSKASIDTIKFDTDLRSLIIPGPFGTRVEVFSDGSIAYWYRPLRAKFIEATTTFSAGQTSKSDFKSVLENEIRDWDAREKASSIKGI